MCYVRKTSDETDVVRIQHGYDRGGNRLYRRDMVASSHSELYQYDQMNQLVKLERGALNSSNTAIVSNTFEEDFTYDVTGNWLNYKQDANGDGTFDVNQTRTHNAANEILTIAGSNASVAHDRNGCMTKVPKPVDGTSGYTLVYDAWNRLISVSDGDTVVATYVYDARNHRIKKTVGNETRLYYFNQQWQCVEERVGTTVDATWIYGLRYIDDVVCRTTNNNGNIQTLYAVQDANWNVVAVLNSNGSVAERMTYDSFGKPTFRAADFTAKTTSSYNWTKTFTGQVYDVETGLMLYRNRYYHPGLGRFITRDPIGYDGNDVNLYRYVKNDAMAKIDDRGFVGAAAALPIAVACAAADGPIPIGDAIALIILGGALLADATCGQTDSISSAIAKPQICDDDPPKTCKPCIPPVGSIAYRVDFVPPSKPHYPYKGTHTHHYKMNQSPYPVCRCFWSKLPVTDGNTPGYGESPMAPADGGGKV